MAAPSLNGTEAANVYQCCFRGCVVNSSKVIEAGDARVNVRAFEPKSKQSTVVSWQQGGAATFHWNCWLDLIKATYDSKSPISLSDVERSMILEAKKTAEYHHSDARVSIAAERIANILKDSNYCIAFTGAGISTAAGIGDFRGIEGKWTVLAKVKNYGAKGMSASKPGKTMADLRPTYSHEALVKLQEMGLLKFLISQNTDGLHRLSGIPSDKIAELHGNSFIEKCEVCDFRYERSSACRQGIGAFEKKCKECNINHRTGGKCSQAGCDGYLINTIINFGDYLESDVLDRAGDEAIRSDAVIVLGSTLMVSPANDLVTMGQEQMNLIICNRQVTPLDRLDNDTPGVRVFGDCDALMKKVMSHLLTSEELQTWESGREARMMEYGLKRTSVK